MADHPVIPKLDQPPTLSELEAALRTLTAGKTGSQSGILLDGPIWWQRATCRIPTIMREFGFEVRTTRACAKAIAVWRAASLQKRWWGVAVVMDLADLGLATWLESLPRLARLETSYGSTPPHGVLLIPGSVSVDIHFINQETWNGMPSSALVFSLELLDICNHSVQSVKVKVCECVCVCVCVCHVVSPFKVRKCTVPTGSQVTRYYILNQVQAPPNRVDYPAHPALEQTLVCVCVGSARMCTCTREVPVTYVMMYQVHDFQVTMALCLRVRTTTITTSMRRQSIRLHM